MGWVGSQWIAGREIRLMPKEKTGEKFVDGKWTDPAPKKSSTKKSAPAGIPVTVQIAGAVNKPGIYKVPDNKRVLEAIAIAGGYLPDADLDKVNLVAFVRDGQRVYLPKIKSGRKSGSGRKTTRKKSSGTPVQAQALKPIDLNLATVEQLEKLPGIGLPTAEEIVKFRQRFGKFRSLDELLNIQGIQTSDLDRLRKFLFLKGAR